MKITVIGGSGFIGTRLISLLNGEPDTYQCKNIDLQPSRLFNRLSVIGDVRNQEEMDRELEGTDTVVLLAAQHRDDVSPVSLYYDTNVRGMEVTLRAMERNGIKRMIFFSSVSVYGINKTNPDETHPADPFNHYGKSKWQAEKVVRTWHMAHPEWVISIIRPTVIFGERNRGNVYNLLKQISSRRFLMVGNGRNVKSMAYVGNVVAFVKHLIENPSEGLDVFNYVDKPDNDMNQLVAHAGKVLEKHIPAVHFPYWLGMLGGYCFDALAKLTGRKLAVSAVRVKKFCATTQFDAAKSLSCGFNPPFTLADGLSRTLEYEFKNPMARNCSEDCPDEPTP